MDVCTLVALVAHRANLRFELMETLLAVGYICCMFLGQLVPPYYTVRSPPLSFIHISSSTYLLAHGNLWWSRFEKKDRSAAFLSFLMKKKTYAYRFNV